MIVERYFDNMVLVEHYSDKNFMLLQNETGRKYSKAIDIVPCHYTYTETDEKVNEISEESEI